MKPATPYSATAKLFHWLVAAAVIATIPVAFAMGAVPPGQTQDSLYNLHKSLGILILGLMALRIANRIVYGAPPAEPTLPSWMRLASSTAHASLYVLLVALPVLGWLANSAYGAVTPFFGLFELPPLLDKDVKLAERIFAVHVALGFLATAIIGVHISAALYHYFIRRDGVLQRMLP